MARALRSANRLRQACQRKNKGSWEQLDFFWKHGLAYAQEMGNRPQTLTDSPVGLAARMLDHDSQSLDLIIRVVMVHPRA